MVVLNGLVVPSHRCKTFYDSTFILYCKGLVKLEPVSGNESDVLLKCVLEIIR